MLLPARTAVLNHMDKVGNADVDEVMEALKPLYGKEKQFTKKLFLDHLMALEANGLLEMTGYEMNPQNELSIRYAITEDGKATAEKYIAKEYR